MNKLTFTYFFLNLICACVFLFCGKILKYAKTDKSYYLRASVPILTFAIVHGMRFGRMIDWNLYYYNYVNLGADVHFGNFEPFFAYTCHFFCNCGVPYFLFITLQCAFLMFCILVLLKNYKSYLPYILPLLLPTIQLNDNYIRWYIGFSFFLLALNSLFNGKKIMTYVWVLCAMGCHIGFVLFVPVLLFGKFLNRATIPSKIAAILLLLTSFTVSLSSISSITSVSDFLLRIGIGTLNQKVEHYLIMTQSIIDGSWGVEMNNRFSTLIRCILAYIPALWLAHYYIDKIKYGKLIYNLFAFGVILTPLFTAEILDRYAKSMAFFSCIACGAFFYEMFHKKIKKYSVAIIIIILSLICAIWPTISSSWNYGKDPRCGNNQMFVWEANNRKTLYQP